MNCGTIHWSAGNYQWSQPQEKWLFFLHQLSVSNSFSAGKGASWTPLPFKWAFWSVWPCACSESMGTAAMSGPEVWLCAYIESTGVDAMSGPGDSVSWCSSPSPGSYILSVSVFCNASLAMDGEEMVQTSCLGLSTQHSLFPAIDWLCVSTLTAAIVKTKLLGQGWEQHCLSINMRV